MTIMMCVKTLYMNFLKPSFNAHPMSRIVLTSLNTLTLATVVIVNILAGSGNISSNHSTEIKLSGSLSLIVYITMY